MSNWSSYVKNFQSYLRIERGLSAHTVANYTFDIERLCKFLSDKKIEISPVKISEESIQQFIYAVSAELNARSQARIISGLKGFFTLAYF
jgi:integrase/recombinase XerD